jgi:hypothetical protein
VQVSSLTWHWIRGAEHSILPSLTVQTEHPSVKSTHDGLSRTNSSIVKTLSGALSSAAAEQEINRAAAQRLSRGPTRRDRNMASAPFYWKNCNFRSRPALKDEMWRFGGAVAINKAMPVLK